MREAVYSGTRNLYHDMETAAKSLVANSSVDKVHFLIEDAEFPHEMPDIVECHDVSGQEFFGHDCANIKTRFSYMSLLRVCYTKLLPDVGKILQLDVDTVCVGDVDPLWDIDLTGKWFAMCEETLGTYKPYGPLYYNAGVAMFNLDQIRADGQDDVLIDFLNRRQVPYIDQDAWNHFDLSKSVGIDPRFNECFVCGYSDDPAIVHFAGVGDWQTSVRTPRREYVRKYREMGWDEIMRLHRDAMAK